MNKIRGLGLAFGLALMSLVAAGAASADGWNATQACNQGQSNVSLQIGYGSGAGYGGYENARHFRGSRFGDRRAMSNDRFGRNQRGEAQRGSRNAGWQHGGRQFSDGQYGSGRGTDHDGSNGGWNGGQDRDRDHNGDGN